MADSHAHPGIIDDEWLVFLADLGATLDKFGVPAAERGELVAIVDSTRADIVRPAGVA